MGKSLVIAEKPSVAADIARVLGKMSKEKDYFEGDSFVVSSAIGHLVELCAPAELEVKRGKWKFESLPVIPDEFDLQPIEKTQARFNLLKRLMKRKDIDTIINACDAGREGELIFRYLAKLAGVQKPIRRLWLQSMTPDAIRTGFENLRSDEEMIPLAKAAASRAEADWLVGINSTRALTAFNSKMGGFQLTPAGRVQTPTLAILVEREEKIRAFQPRAYFEVFADFGVEAGSYRGRWFDETFKKTDEETKAERIWVGSRAEEIKQKCLGKIGVVTEEKKPTSQAAPLLYDLTTLQREANGRFGYSARRTLQLAQQLYERHKVLTYPRTDSRYLAEDQLSQVREIMGGFADPTLARHGRKALENQWVKPSKRIFNNAKVSDHTAIIPTGETPKNLDEAQQKIFDLVARRFIAVFYPAAQFEITTRLTRVEGEAFRTDGKIIVDPGWLAVYGREAASEDENDRAIVPIIPGEPAKVLEIETRESMTKPPARFNEATLLSAMEGAGKLVDDEDLREAMSAKGLGTPATRASVIEGLIFQEYILRKGRELIATSRGISLITLLRSLGVGALCLPELTGEWEFKLKQIEQSQLQRREFMEQIRELTRDAVEKIKHGSDPAEDQFPPLEAPCPKCQHSSFKQDYRTFRCASCDYRVWKNLAGREFAAEEVKALLTDRRIGPLDGFRSKMGRAFSAEVILGEDLKPQLKFENQGAEGIEAADLADQPQIGTCPVCQKGRVFDLEKAYACEHAVSAEKSCTLRMGKTILQREIPREQAIKLLETGKTDLIRGFISKKGRPFEAYLKLEKGKVAFEFEERKKAAPRKKGAKSPPPAPLEA